MKIGERMAAVETRLKSVERVLYILVVAVAAHFGVVILPSVSAFLG